MRRFFRLKAIGLLLLWTTTMAFVAQGKSLWAEEIQVPQFCGQVFYTGFGDTIGFIAPCDVGEELVLCKSVSPSICGEDLGFIRLQNLVYDSSTYCLISYESCEEITDCSECEGWGSAYRILFQNPADLALFRLYRDEILVKTSMGRLYKDMIYENSGEALQILIENPALLIQLRHIIQKNAHAVAEVFGDQGGVIQDTGEIVSFLDSYAERSPANLKLLVHAVKEDMLKRRERGDPFLGFKLK
jgi:TusA-related sulfurtransferase